ncbi:MAG: hypothetical protein IPO16_11890 [Saprospiraceae bacterium]|nr:hypothetical protein [Saprospiraceae bacterium]
MKPNWTEYIRKIANEHSTQVPDQIWDNVKLHLPKKEPRNRMFILFLLLLIMAAISIFAYQRKYTPILNSDKNIVSNEKLSSTIPLNNKPKSLDPEQNLKLKNENRIQNNTLLHSRKTNKSIFEKESSKSLNSKIRGNFSNDPLNTNTPEVPSTFINHEQIQTLQTFPIQNSISTLPGILINEHPHPNIAFEHLPSLKSKTDCYNFNKDNKQFVSFETYVGPAYSPYKLTNTHSDLSLYINKRKASENSMISVMAGIRLGYHRANFAVKTGLEYHRIYEQFNYRNPNETKIVYVYKDTHLVSIDTIPGERILKIHNYHSLLNIPFSIAYKYKWNKMTISLEPGFGINILAKHKGSILDTNNQPALFTTGSLSGFEIYKKRIGTFAFLNLQVAAPLNKKLLCFVEPGFIYYFNSFTESSYPLEQKYISANLKIGITLKL